MSDTESAATNPAGGHEIYGMPGHLIRRLHQISIAYFNERMSGMGLDLTAVQYSALSVLAERPGIDQATLAGLIAYDRATIGGVVDRLEAKKLISRRVSPRDRRARVLAPTSAGLALLDRVAPGIAEAQADITRGLAPEERAEFMRLLERLVGDTTPPVR